MQLATCRDNQPWACNVHYFSDGDLNLYWFSEPGRRHSLELKDNPRASAVIQVHENTPEEDYVIGITVEGNAKEVTEFDDKILETFRDKHNKGENFIEEVKSGKKSSRLYKLTPTNIVLFDNRNFEGNPRQEWSLSSSN
jgi:nitroimidazol reductase NimA-like FMN-containing flavoprotein (pyridoxamine 5'-phosphate oxidase superfamily)